MCGMVWFFFILNRTSKMLFAKKLIEDQPTRNGPRGSSKSGSKNKSQTRRSTSKFFHHAGTSHFTVISQGGRLTIAGKDSRGIESDNVSNGDEQESRFTVQVEQSRNFKDLELIFRDYQKEIQ